MNRLINDYAWETLTKSPPPGVADDLSETRSSNLLLTVEVHPRPQGNRNTRQRNEDSGP